MKTTVFEKPGKVVLKDFPMPEIQEPKDAVVKILRACVCGSDLWWFRGLDKRETGTTAGHEAIGIVQSVGDGVTHVQPGDFVILPFTHGCGHCAACKAGFEGNCLNAKGHGSSSFQGEYVRYTEADWSLVKIPGQPEDYTDEQLNDLLALSDVMATGYHAAASAEVHPGDTVVVMGDGAVGLCGVIAAKLMGATRIIAMSRHADRQAMAREFGATDIVEERGDEAVAKVLAMTDGGADAVLECVGTALSVDTAIKVARPGAIVGRVGVPQEATNANAMPFWTNVGLRGGIASVTTYDRGVLLDAVLQGKIHPGHVFTQRFDLADVQSAYEAMDKREAIKSLLIVSK
ncbi:zinc-dependent alcohol dehydrogenase family protein [Lacticaseibacillus camelliae]|uniref:Alcohol dehydrogenase n=1 Tax=Lacticaseibacillus camelliae DSM 22697 = JCM 13995 TaxID=1423730 RepID=A0A0R2ERU7_9LACO|nr:zinc-dependent alcohol dehydrogenase family protein [Lacticaseibacillus camelliae]KRN18150.1 alcohol dehydrogenase [Lacticaseibacillus camelliae DSM 22697 = JCM 13995]